MSSRSSSQAAPIIERRSFASAIPRHLPQYLTEAFCLGLFMLVACLMTGALEYPVSRLHQLIPNPIIRRLLMGTMMGATAASIIYSPAGRFSGAHMNPAVTLTFLRLGKIERRDALAYMLSQVTGGLIGVSAAALLLGEVIAYPSVRYAATVPGKAGPVAGFVAEGLISLILMSTVLRVSNSSHWARYTGCVVAFLVAVFIAVEGPFSGMSMNPARSIASAIPSGIWISFWIYLTAPPLGMLLAAGLYNRRGRGHAVLCAKLHHDTRYSCIFRCGYAQRSVKIGDTHVMRS